MADVSNRDDIIDSRDVVKRLEELEEAKADLEQTRDEAESDDDKEAAETALADWLDENGDELKARQTLSDDAPGYAADWHHGTTLVRDSYFENYARELAEDLHGDRIRSAEWPMNHIDWSAAADSLQQDYTAVEFDGVTYWVR